MTNYNDGNWHKMNGEMPESVHPLSEVEMKWILLNTGDIKESTRIAKHFEWGNFDDVFGIAFRVVKEQKEPREFWASEMEWIGLGYKEKSWGEVDKGAKGAILFREVLE